ncbi:GNAT family N-acetyltransferase [Parasphingorhabdus sp.]|uniref:GNAT family N-acetyltransferase n=1 Tax=Parasphingorhabdus sp. TaxID=2709688 RepID=UPI003A90BDE4
MSINIVTSRETIESYIDEIQAAGDSERNAFGFLVPGAYKEFVYQERAVIAISDDDHSLAGYVLYGGAFPQAKIFQTYVLPDRRGQKVGEKLLAAVFQRLEDKGFLSVVANVASDLTDANSFYDSMGFDIVTTKPGGKTTQRLINVRARDLSTPSLLDSLERPSSPVHSIAFRSPYQSSSPLYILDLNVIFDVTKKRPRSKVAQGVIAAGMENGARIAITDELIAELEKHTLPDKPDPILGLCRALPRLRLPSSDQLREYREKLLPVVFPEKANAGTLKANDEADLRHLTTAILENAKGFITSDTPILRASTELEAVFGLAILSPSAFGQGFAVEYGGAPSTFASTKNATIERCHFSETDKTCLNLLLSKFHLPEQVVRTVTAAGTASAPRRRELVRSNGALICFASWDAPSAASGERQLYVYADEGHPDASLGINNLLESACRDIGHQNVAIFSLKTLVHQHLVRSTAISFGFHSEIADRPKNSMLRKACLGRAIVPEHWNKLKDDVEEAIGIKVSGSLSSHGSNPIKIQDAKGNQIAVSLLELEELLSPAVLSAQDRPGVIFPIWPSYAEDLFHGGQQPSFLDQQSAILKPTKAYIGGNYGSVPEGGLAFFYESSKQNGRSAIIAVARILKRYSLTKEQAKSISVDRGVLPDQAIDGITDYKKLTTVTDIDSIMLFANPIGYRELGQLGCDNGTNFITSTPINPDQCMALIRAGAPYIG